MVSIKYDGRELPQSPIRVDVGTGIDTSLAKANDIPDTGDGNCPPDLTVDTSALPPDTNPQIDCHIVTPSGQLLPNVVTSPVDDDGQVAVNYTPTEVGKHDINISCDDELVKGSPWKVNAIQGSDPRKVRAYGPGLELSLIHI